MMRRPPRPLTILFLVVAALLLLDPPQAEARARKKTKIKSKEAESEQTAAAQKGAADIASQHQHPQAMKRAKNDEQHQQFVNAEAACKENPRSADLARQTGYMYYHAGQAVRAVKHFDRVRTEASAVAAETSCVLLLSVYLVLSRFARGLVEL